MATFLPWQPLPETDPLCGRVRALLGKGPDAVRYARLPFYTDVFVVAVGEQAGLVHQGTLLPLDGTNDTILALNQRAALRLDRERAELYVRFFLYYVRGHGQQLQLIEQPRDLLWQDGAPERLRRSIDSQLLPLTWRGIARDHHYELHATALLHPHLFRIRLRLAQDGALDILNEAVIAEDLPLRPV